MTTPLRLAPILAQFEFEQDRLLTHLVGLTDEEYLWEPVPDCWSIRPRGQVDTNRAAGGGAWQLERHHPEPEPPPFTTLAWRLCHLASTIALRADYTIGTKSLTWGTYNMPSTAEAGIAALRDALASWAEHLPPGRHLQGGQRSAGGGQCAPPGLRRAGAARGQRLGHADDRQREHQQPLHHDRREVRGHDPARVSERWCQRSRFTMQSSRFERR